MSKCPKCDRENTWSRGTTEARYGVGDLTFTARVPGKKCSECGEWIVGLHEMEALGRAASEWVARNAEPTAELFRYLRRSIGLPATELATLLDTDKATISKWESGKQGFNRGTWATLAAIVLDAHAGRTDTRDRLRAISEPRPGLAKTIAVTLKAPRESAGE